MSEQSIDPRFRDPLSEVTRRERRFLLAVAFSELTIVLGGAMPNAIPAFGLEHLTGGNLQILLWAFVALTIYAVAAFVLYAWSDFVSWRQAIVYYDLNVLDDLRSPLVSDTDHSSRANVVRDDREWANLNEAVNDRLGFSSVPTLFEQIHLVA